MIVYIYYSEKSSQEDGGRGGLVRMLIKTSGARVKINKKKDEKQTGGIGRGERGELPLKKYKQIYSYQWPLTFNITIKREKGGIEKVDLSVPSSQKE